MQAFAGSQRYDELLAERQAGRDLPLLAYQRDLVGIARQAIEIRTEVAGKGFQLDQRLTLLEGFGVQLDGGMGGVAAGTAASGFLGMLGMGRRVGTQEELRVAAGGSVQQGFLMQVALEHR